MKQRLRDIGEGRIALSRSGAPAVTHPDPAATEPWTSVWSRPASVVSALAIAGVAALAGWYVKPVPEPAGELVRLSMALPAGIDLANDLTMPDVALSPDGTQVVYAGLASDRARPASAGDQRPLETSNTQSSVCPSTDALPTATRVPSGDSAGAA